MFKKYEKTFRFEQSGKRCLSKPQIKQLFAGKIVVEEKLDGANTGIIRHKEGFHLQKRGSLVGQSEHEQFQFFHSWAWNKYEDIEKLPLDTIVYGELMRCIHTIEYTKLPDWFICFDVWTGKRFLTRREKEDFCEEYNFDIVPLIADGKGSPQEVIDMVPKKSEFGGLCEGVVVKKYNKKQKNFMKGKWINPEFYEKMDEKHWVTLPVRYNKVIQNES